MCVFNSFLPSTEGVGGGSGVQRMTETAKRAKFNVLARSEDIYFYFFISSSLSGFGVSMSSVDSAYIYTSSSSFLQRAESWTSVKCFPFRQVGKVPRKRVKFLTTTFFTHFFSSSSHLISFTRHLILYRWVCVVRRGRAVNLFIKSSQARRAETQTTQESDASEKWLNYFILHNLHFPSLNFARDDVDAPLRSALFWGRHFITAINCIQFSIHLPYLRFNMREKESHFYKSSILRVIQFKIYFSNFFFGSLPHH